MAEQFFDTSLEPRVIGGAGSTAASALKMVYSAWTKGSAALLLAIEQTETEREVGPDLLLGQLGSDRPVMRIVDRSSSTRAVLISDSPMPRHGEATGDATLVAADLEHR